jgi:hypothetical protein
LKKAWKKLKKWKKALKRKGKESLIRGDLPMREVLRGRKGRRGRGMRVGRRRIKIVWKRI